MGRMTAEQLELLEALVDAYWSNEKGQPKLEFMFYTASQVGTQLQHAPGFGEEGVMSIDLGDVEELAGLGLVSVNYSGTRQGTLVPTAEGRFVVEEQRRLAEVIRADKAISGGGASIRWEAMFPVLEAVMDLYDEARAGENISQPQVCHKLDRPEGDEGVSRAFEAMQEAGYLKGHDEIDQVPGPLTVAPTEKALQLLAGWPADGAVAYERLLAILDKQIEVTDDAVEKGKLKAFRESAANMGQSVAVGVLTKVITGGLE